MYSRDAADACGVAIIDEDCSAAHGFVETLAGEFVSVWIDVYVCFGGAHAVLIHCLESVPIGVAGSLLPRRLLHWVWLGRKPAGSCCRSGLLVTG